MLSHKSDSRIQRARRTLNTVRYLKPRQALYFFLRRGVGQQRVSPWVGKINIRCITKPSFPSFEHGDTDAEFFQFTFLNRTLRFPRDDINWNPSNASRLWRYHLHYFDFLRDIQLSKKDKLELIDSWIECNPQESDASWEPYTASLRIVNWCLFFLSIPRESLKDRWLISLYEQAIWLECNLELHILANHYFENIKALLFAGFFFSDRNSDRWLNKFQINLIKELSEQTLEDGGHYERSPYYHSIILQNCIELYALNRSNPNLLTQNCASQLKISIQSGLTFLQKIQTPDDDIPLFNDSVSLRPGTLTRLKDAAAQQGIATDTITEELIDLAQSGYYGYKKNEQYFLIDCGDIGPTYQPGHTHCDFLSYVLMINRQWLVVDSGVYEYQPGEMRRYVRSTAAHNTVCVDQHDQSEMWAEFRVGLRAEKEYAHIASTSSKIEFIGRFKGFPSIAGRIQHQRKAVLELTENGSISAVTIDDEISGRGHHQLTSYIHLHPDITAIINEKSIALLFEEKLIASIDFNVGIEATLNTGWYCPEFGKKQPNQVINLHCNATLPHRFGYRFNLRS